MEKMATLKEQHLQGRAGRTLLRDQRRKNLRGREKMSECFPGVSSIQGNDPDLVIPVSAQGGRVWHNSVRSGGGNIYS